MKRRVNSFLNMVPIKNKNKKFWRKKNIKHFYGSLKFKEWKGTGTCSFRYKYYIISILIFCFLKTCLQFFLTQIFRFYSKNVLFLCIYNFRLHPFPFKPLIFLEKMVSKKVRESVESKNSKKLTYLLFLPVTFHSSKHSQKKKP